MQSTDENLSSEIFQPKASIPQRDDQTDEQRHGKMMVADIPSAALRRPGASEDQQASPASAACLTAREAAVLDLLTSGLTNKETAACLHISHRTVETHRKRIITKYGAKNLVGVMQIILTQGQRNG